MKPNHPKYLVRRSSLIFPINVPRFVEKASTRGADCIIMDLEDSVPHTEKAAARTLVKDYIPIVGRGGGDVAVRINAPINESKKDLGHQFGRVSHASPYPRWSREKISGLEIT